MSMSKSEIETKYGVTVVLDKVAGRSNYYKIYSADGQPWANYLRSMVAVETYCRRWKEELLKIKESVKEANV